MHPKVILLALLVMSCAPRGEFVAAPAGPDTASRETIFVGTTRVAGVQGYTDGRSDVASFVRYDISIPPEREAGTVSYPRRGEAANLDKHFLVLNETRFGGAPEFRSSLKAAMRARGQTDAVVYVHGFNSTMAEGVVRVAQLHHDLKVPGVAVHYAWPSAGSALAYVHDRDSILFARAGFEALLNEVAASGAREIVIVAHSMGAALTMEVLRQIALDGNTNVMSRIAGVVLISPDLDVEVFQSQARDIGTLPQPFVIFGSSKDRVLGLSAILSAEETRLGNLDDLSKIANLKVTYFDTAAYDVGAGHQNFGTNPVLLSLFDGIVGIDSAFRADDRARVGLLPGIVLTVRNATGVILAPVVALDKVVD
ncbi:MAG: alpha/beta fold hydrolase [Rhodobacterales bacterium]|nr:alpha/beta fold hydrolase [Rhodobacterales bacterium]